MKYRYFANVMAHIEFEVEADSREEADVLAGNRLDNAKWDEFTDVGAEMGYIYGGPGEWEEVLRYGDI